MSSELRSAVDRCKSGDVAAFEIIMRAFERRVLVIAYSILGNSEEAMEVMQETFFRLFKNLGRIRSEAGFSRFICKIATNYAIDLRRRRKRQYVSLDDEAELPASVNLQLADSRTKPDRLIERNELWQALKEAVASLPEKQRTTLVLHDIENISKAEIGKIMGCPQGTVRSNLHIARKKLQAKLKEHL